MALSTADFDYALPEALIAQEPLRPRDAARLLLVQGDKPRDHHVRDLPALLKPGDVMVVNDTRVIPARLTGQRTRATPQGDATARIEVTLLEPEPDGLWRALAKPLRKLRPGEVVRFGDRLSAEIAAINETELTLRFDAEGAALDAALETVGAMPLPPYIAAKRAPDEADRTDYQTVWAQRPGAVAAPGRAVGSAGGGIVARVPPAGGSPFVSGGSSGAPMFFIRIVSSAGRLTAPRARMYS